MALYSCTHHNSQGWTQVVKFNDDYDVESVYHLEPLKDGRFFCYCPGHGHHGYCRHIDIQKKFMDEKKFNKGYLLEFETGKFFKMIGAFECS